MWTFWALGSALTFLESLEDGPTGKSVAWFVVLVFGLIGFGLNLFAR